MNSKYTFFIQYEGKVLCYHSNEIIALPEVTSLEKLTYDRLLQYISDNYKISDFEMERKVVSFNPTKDEKNFLVIINALNVRGLVEVPNVVWKNFEDLTNITSINTIIKNMSNANKVETYDYESKEGDKIINKVLIKNNFSINTWNKQINSINGHCYRDKKKYFFKGNNIRSIMKEILGYSMLNKKYPIPIINEIFFTKNIGIIIFEYEHTVGLNKGLLFDFINKFKDLDDDIVIKNILDLYKKNFKNRLLRSKFPNDKFFRNRAVNLIPKWYIEKKEITNLLHFDVCLNGTHMSSTIDIIKKCTEHFNNEFKLTSVLSQGDPTEMNIGIKPIFFDFETAGYNSIVGEIAILFWSLYIAGDYFYIKYHPEAYKMHKKEDIEDWKSGNNFLDFQIDKFEKVIDIRLNYKPSLIRKEIIGKYMDIFEEDLWSEINLHLPYYIVLRVIGSLNITKMSEFDQILCIAFLHLFFKEEINYKAFLIELLE